MAQAISVVAAKKQRMSFLLYASFPAIFVGLIGYLAIMCNHMH